MFLVVSPLEQLPFGLSRIIIDVIMIERDRRC